MYAYGTYNEIINSCIDIRSKIRYYHNIEQGYIARFM